MVEQQSEKWFGVAQGPTQAMRAVVEDGAGGPAVVTAAGLMIEGVRTQFDRRDTFRRHTGGGVWSLFNGWPRDRTGRAGPLEWGR